MMSLIIQVFIGRNPIVISCYKFIQRSVIWEPAYPRAPSGKLPAGKLLSGLDLGSLRTDQEHMISSHIQDDILTEFLAKQWKAQWQAGPAQIIMNMALIKQQYLHCLFVSLYLKPHSKFIFNQWSINQTRQGNNLGSWSHNQGHVSLWGDSYRYQML